jgi:zinc metalloprotease ZmpA
MKIRNFVLAFLVPSVVYAADRSQVPVRTPQSDQVTHRYSDLGLSPQDVVMVHDEISDANSIVHRRFERFYRDLHVLGGDFVVHETSTGQRQKAPSATFRGQLAQVVRVARLTAAEAVTIGMTAFPGLRSETESTAQLAIYAYGEAPRLAYDVIVEGMLEDETPSIFHAYVDAQNGDLLGTNNEIQQSTGTGKSLYVGTVALQTNAITSGFEMRDTLRGGTTTSTLRNKQNGNSVILTDADNIWGNFTVSDINTAGVDAHYGVATTFDYYKLTFGRNGIANDGRGSANRVHYGRNYANAFWSDKCFCMTYGDGNGSTFAPLVSLDVAGHEMSHGVTSRTANLVYSGESGGLNEATSDIFGTCVEFYANNTNDPGDYFIGEKIVLTGNHWLRNMADPRADGNSIDHFSLFTANLNVHYSSGIANNFFYLLAEGGTNRTSGLSVVGIGRDHAQRIWYRALTVYMTSGTTFRAARAATLSAAADLYGAGSVDHAAVAAAWTAVGVVS